MKRADELLSTSSRNNDRILAVR